MYLLREEWKHTDLADVSRVAATTLMMRAPVRGASCFRFPVTCGQLLSDLFASCLTVARQTAPPPPLPPTAAASLPTPEI